MIQQHSKEATPIQQDPKLRFPVKLHPTVSRPVLPAGTLLTILFNMLSRSSVGTISLGNIPGAIALTLIP